MIGPIGYRMEIRLVEAYTQYASHNDSAIAA